LFVLKFGVLKKSMSKIFYKKMRKILCRFSVFLVSHFRTFLWMGSSKTLNKYIFVEKFTKISKQKHPPTYVGVLFCFFVRPLLGQPLWTSCTESREAGGRRKWVLGFLGWRWRVAGRNGRQPPLFQEAKGPPKNKSETPVVGSTR
jgi:hypothetical protein